MKPSTHNGRFGGVSTHFVAAILVIIVATGIVLLVQHKASNPRLSPSREAVMRIQRVLSPTAAVMPDTIYMQSSAIQIDLNQPRGIAVGPKSELYVVGDKQLLKYDNAGKLLSKAALSTEPHAVCAAPDGTVYIGMRDRVEARKEDGTGASVWDRLGSRAYITSLCANGSKVWVADAGNRVVLEYDAGGKLVRTFGEKDASKNVRGLIVPSPHMDVGVDSKGSLWVANPGRHSLEEYTENGSVTRYWGKAGFGLQDFCGCCNPSDFAIGPNDEFITSEKGLLRVKVYSPAGKIEGLVASGEEFKGGATICTIKSNNKPFENSPPEGVSGTVLDLAAGQDGRVYVLDPGARCIRVYCLK